MSLSQRFAALDRVQQSLMFKIIASCIVAALAVGTLVNYGVQAARMESSAPLLRVMSIDPAPEGQAASPAAAADLQAAQQIINAGEAWARFFNDLRGTRFSLLSVGTGIGLTLALALAVVWLGVALTYLGVFLIGCVTALPLIIWGVGAWRDAGFFIAGALILAAGFSALIQVLRALLSSASPITAIAKNLVAEAVRMKLSLIFIMMIIFALASLPGLLDETTPLRYRVQTFLQYATSGTYLITAVLVLFLSCGSVTFEQRDKVIWQTMTKPVRAWQYVLGKWLGVSGVAAVLLTVSGTGVYLFTEYLRMQKAQGELAPFVAESGSTDIAEDRMVLESQVLVARISVRPTIQAADEQVIDAEITRRALEQQKRAEQDRTGTEPLPDPVKIRLEVEKEVLQSFFSIEPAQWKRYEFLGLKNARTINRPLTLRYKLNAGGNLPTDLYKLTFFVEGSDPFVRQVHLDQRISMPMSSAAIVVADPAAASKQIEAAGLQPSLANDPRALRREVAHNKGLSDANRAGLESLANELDGVLRLQINNGDFSTQIPNPQTVVFPPDGLEVSFPVSSWQSNFVRVQLVMLMKLMFLSIIAIAAGTFLSFPVAAMLAFGIFFVAEGAGFLSQALDSYSPKEAGGEIIWYRVVVLWIAEPIASLFKFYADLRPTESLVEGRLVSWFDVGRALVLLGALSSIIFAAGTVIFRRRELATYSGQ